ncbi:ubiquitin carboxyl-terminal hydrolase 8-like [Saccoglossus kowalevskii]|uniref:ubiquitinyl hydrolase 1 n=1 Tax=Saccoglossus kowalevskii TaxID=10224 RepID=A0ABM0M1V9_SACKO|nr:PREDICTED: ubiquitin carboxyl-terminal hydrolase 8-like [Saccoglossus kowalevskii]
MPAEGKKKLYVARSMEELNKMADHQLVKGWNIKNYCSSASKVFSAAEQQFKLGDEEKSYVLYMKYFNIVKQIHKTKEYKADKKFFTSLLGQSSSIIAIEKAEILAEHLNKRYSEFQEEEELRKRIEDEERMKLETENDEKEDEKNSNHESLEIVSTCAEGEITPVQLYSLFEDEDASVLLMDVRPATQFEVSRITHRQCINVPADIIKPGTLTSAIEKGLSTDALELWNKRGSFDYIILLDWDSDLSSVTVGSTLHSLKDAIYKWDSVVIVKSKPLILEGGYDAWLLHYPQFTTNPSIPRPPKYREVAAITTLLDFDYPTLEDEPPKKPLTSSESLHENFNGSQSKDLVPGIPSSNSLPAVAPMPQFDRSNKPKSSEPSPAIHSVSMPQLKSLSLDDQSATLTRNPSVDRSKKPNLSDGVVNDTGKSPEEEKSNIMEEMRVQQRELEERIRIEKVRIKEAENAAKNQEMRQKQEEEKARLEKLRQQAEEMRKERERKERELDEAKKRAAQQQEDRVKQEKENALRKDAEMLAKRKDAEMREKREAAKKDAEIIARREAAKKQEEQEKTEQEALRIKAELADQEEQQKRAQEIEMRNREIELERQRKLREEELERMRKAKEDDEQRKKLKEEEEKMQQMKEEKIRAEQEAIKIKQSEQRLKDEQEQLAKQQAKGMKKVQLPAGWEKKLDSNTGRYYYIDHGTGTTHWKLPDTVTQSGKPRNRDLSSYKVPLESEPKSNLKRSHSSPNVAQLVDSDLRRPTPQFDRSSKPLIRPSRPNVEIRTSDVSAAQVRNLNPVFGNQGRALTGLKNLGNTCFMNSIIQSLANSTPLATYFIEGSYKYHINRENKLGRGGKVAEEFAVVINAIWSGHYRSISPRDFKLTVSKFVPQFAGYEQQDSQEFLLFLLDGLHEDLNRVKHRKYIEEKDNTHLTDDQAAQLAWNNHKRLNESIMVELFQGQFKSTLQCLFCQKKSVTYDAFMYLSLPLLSNNRCSLYDCVKNFTKLEKVGGADKWFCPKCKVHREANKRIEIWKLPHILLIHLKRFSYEGVWRHKLQTDVDFPINNLDMSSHVIGPKKRSSYNLYAVSNHYGTMDGGHYTAFCKNAIRQKWYKFDDTEVYEMPTRNVKSSAAYILFYTSIELPPPAMHTF